MNPRSPLPQRELSLADFDYTLPPELVAKFPLSERDQSRMLHLGRQHKEIAHYSFSRLPELLNAGDLVIVNNAKVIPIRLIGKREIHSGKVELFLMHPQNAEQTQWQVLMKPAKRLSPGSVICFEHSPLQARIIERLEGGRGLVELSWPDECSFEEILSKTGTMPIPPYLDRAPEAIDDVRYQTVFAKHPGAQAAPTAGLHFTEETFKQLEAQGIQVEEITLQVSAGTFRPVLTDTIQDHQMDPEFYTISEAVAQKIVSTRQQGGRVIAVGTTVAKTLETSASHHQGVVKAESAWSDLFIHPGFQFQVIDGLLTNFHLPKSTLLMLVSAFCDRDAILKAYHEAIGEGYRFYSYGDCMLIL